jgi:hypothetical protein
VRSALKPETSAATRAAKDFATALATAQHQVINPGLIANAVGATTQHSSAITLAGADLLEIYNKAIEDSNAAQTDYTRAIAITAGLTFTSADSLESLIKSVDDYKIVRDAFVIAGGDMSTILTGTGKAFKDFLAYVNGLIGHVGVTAPGGGPGQTVIPAALTDTWVGDIWRSPGGVTLDRAGGTFATPTGNTGTFADAQATLAAMAAAVAAGGTTELAAGTEIILKTIRPGWRFENPGHHPGPGGRHLQQLGDRPRPAVLRHRHQLPHQ